MDAQRGHWQGRFGRRVYSYQMANNKRKKWAASHTMPVIDFLSGQLCLKAYKAFRRLSSKAIQETKPTRNLA